MSTPSYPDINDRTYSFSSIELDVNGDLYTAFKSINYSDNMEPGELRGAAQHLLGRTAGDYKADGSFEMSRAEFKLLKAKLGAGFMLVSFPVSVTYAENETSNIIHDELIGCRIKKVDYSNSQGPDPSMVKVDLHVTYIVHDGVIPFFMKRPSVG
jgi:hypothetical protein